MNASLTMHSLFKEIKLMNQTLEQLIKLQEIDQRLLEIKDFMGDLPITVENQENEVKSILSGYLDILGPTHEKTKETRRKLSSLIFS